MGFSKQEYWSGLPCLPPGALPDPAIEPRSLELQADSFTIWATREAIFLHIDRYLIFYLPHFPFSDPDLCCCKYMKTKFFCCHCCCFLLFYFSLHWVFVFVDEHFSSCSEQGLLSNCRVRVSHCSGFSGCRTQALGCTGCSSCGSGALECGLSTCGTWA